MAPKFGKNLIDLRVGAKSWKPGGDTGSSGGIHGSRGRWVSSPSMGSIASGSQIGSQSGSVNGDPRLGVHFLSPGSSDRGSSGRLTPSRGIDDIYDAEFEQQAKELEAAQKAQEAAMRAEELAKAASEAERRIADAEASQKEIDDLQEQRMTELLRAQEELAARERELKDKEDRIAALMKQEEERHAEEMRQMQERARREEEERRARLEALQKEEEERRERLEQLEKQREQERAVAAEQEMMRRLEEERQRLAEEERLAIERRVQEEKEAQKAASERLRAEIRAREEAAYARNQKRRNQLLNITSSATRPVNPPTQPKLQPVSYARYLRSPSVASFDMPLSPAYHLDRPPALPADVKRAGEARQRELEALVEAAEAKARAAEEYRDHLAETEARDAEERRSRLSSRRSGTSYDSPSRTPRGSSMTRESGSHRRRSTEAAKRKSAEVKARRKSADEAHKRKSSPEEDEQRRRMRAAAEELKRRREAEEDARIRGAEMAAYFMAKQDLRRPRQRRPSISRAANSEAGPRGLKERAKSPPADLRARGLNALHRQAPEGVHASAPIGRVNSPPLPLAPRQRRDEGSMMGPRPGLPSSDGDTTPRTVSEADPSALFIVVSADKVVGYSHDVLELVTSSATTDVGKTPAMAFINGTEAGRNEDREGKRAAVEKLVHAAEVLGADAVISLRLQSPRPVNDTQVEYTASGIAVRLKLESPERLPVRYASPLTLPNGQKLFADAASRPPLSHIASAPIVGLRTPSSEATTPTARTLGSDTDGTATPKASAFGLPPLPDGLKSAVATPKASSRPTSPRLYPLPPSTPEEASLTPHGIALPESPAFSDPGTPRASRYATPRSRSRPRFGAVSRSASRTPRMMEELWIGDDWAEASPAMQLLKSPMAPSPMDPAALTPKADTKGAALIDFSHDKDLNALRERTQAMMPCWEGLSALAAGA